MVSKYLSTKNQSGFSLMELLVTVSIIGVLSTAGVPVYRRMVSKAKTSEAKVNLGALANTESMFQSEYSVYGNNLYAMGFGMDGAPANALYAVGFFSGTCTSAAVTPAANLAVNNGLPNYINNIQTVFGRAQASVLRDNAGAAVANSNGPKTVCPAVATMTATDAAYVAAAAGGIRNGVDPNAGANNDVWTIDNARQLLHVVDGT